MAASNFHAPTVLVFLKAPRLGTVKTRLATDTDPDHALAVYRHLAEGQLRRLSGDWPVEIHFAPHDAGDTMQAWLGDAYAYHPQVDGDLGHRLHHATRSAFERGASSVACVGGDCPQLDTSHFEKAYSLLRDSSDVVFGPASDGGYYLVAMRQLQSELFRDIPWSSEDTLAASLRRAEEARLRVAQLETLFDIDERADLERAIALGLLPADLMPAGRR